ncbi:dimethylsulfonioproprionate lyase family protein [Roseovarius aestuariivivens]|uniref:dimethylsulfonioproprionate lyase family protein n=1 Tax=Roseovarius aestuariivivens TaxID=1888910 RepID=UPI001080F9DE|nr:dimethylsulfonioproprionate lyase family protein [Roseovarius aestuariivivens]
MPRPAALQNFLEAALTAFAVRATDARAQASISACARALGRPGDISDTPGARLPVCAELAAAADPARMTDPALETLLQAFHALEPHLTWTRRQGDMTHASANIAEGHANALILGPGGLERRADVWLGASLLAPYMRYPDHSHPPEETYLVLTDGAFRQGEGAWFTPGPGGSFYNPPHILHAMRSFNTPLFAFWLLRAGDPA